MKIKKAFCLLLACLMAGMCGCSEKEEQVRPAQYLEKADFMYANSFSLPKDTDMGLYEFTQYGGENKIDALSGVFLTPDEKLSSKKEDIFAKVPTQKLETEDGSKMLAVTDNGRFLYHDFEREPKLFAISRGDFVFPENYEETHISFNEYEGAYLQELSDKALSYITDCLMVFGVEIKLRPEFALLYTLSSDEEPEDPTVPEKEYYYADFFFTLDLDDGLTTVKPSRSDSYMPYTLEQYYKTDEISFSISASMYDADKPFEVESLYELIIPTGLTQKINHMDCDQAIIYAYNKYFMNAKNMKLTHAELEYHPYVDSYDKTLWSESFEHQTGAVYSAEPYWALYFDTPNIQLKLCINALNGKIKTVEQPKGFLSYENRQELREPICKIDRGYDFFVYYGIDEEEFYNDMKNTEEEE